jgi:hypothetical protein
MARTSSDLYNPGGKRASSYPAYPLDKALYYWDDIRVPGTQVAQFGERPPDVKLFQKTGSSFGVWAYAFDASEVEDLHFSVQIPHTWREGSTVYPHLHWTPSDTASGTVVWTFEYTWANVWEAFTETNYLEATPHATNNIDREQLITSFHYDYANGINGLPPALTEEYKAAHPSYYDIGDPKQISSMLMCRIVRHATHDDDTYPSDAFFLEFDIHIEVNSPGSVRPFQKVGTRDTKYRL